jgi:hypothetical protein
MAMSFPSTVNPPGGASYSAPLLNFSQFANWAADDPYAAKRKEQEQQLNSQAIQQRQQQLDLAKAFPNGLPIDPKTGVVDYPAVAQTFAKFGSAPEALNILQQQPAPLSPLLGGQPGAPAAASPDLAPPRPRLSRPKERGKIPDHRLTALGNSPIRHGSNRSRSIFRIWRRAAATTSCLPCEKYHSSRAG